MKEYRVNKHGMKGVKLSRVLFEKKKVRDTEMTATDLEATTDKPCIVLSIKIEIESSL